jgi:hypothetical protein
MSCVAPKTSLFETCTIIIRIRWSSFLLLKALLQHNEYEKLAFPPITVVIVVQRKNRGKRTAHRSCSNGKPFFVLPMKRTDSDAFHDTLSISIYRINGLQYMGRTHLQPTDCPVMNKTENGTSPSLTAPPVH